jgi:hypothetical protein
MELPLNLVFGDALMSRGKCAPNSSPAQGSARVKRPPQMGTAPALVRELPLICRRKNNLTMDDALRGSRRLINGVV